MAKSTRASPVAAVSDDSAAEVEEVANKSASKQKSYGGKKKAKDASEEEVEHGDEATTDADAKGEDENKSGEEGGGEEVYEIEKILDAKMGYFKAGRYGYFVHWKGYPKDEDSWVDEPDAEGARELIDEFWENRKNKKKGSSAPRSAAKRKSSATSDELGADITPVKPTKGRTSTSQKKGRVSDVQAILSDEEEEPEPRLKRPRKSSVSTRKASNGNHTRKRAKVEDEMDVDVPPVSKDSIDTSSEEWSHEVPEKYLKKESWENLVEGILTVERGEEKSLYIFWSSTDGRHFRTRSSLFKKKCPQQLINFYETNLKWRLAEDEQAQQA